MPLKTPPILLYPNGHPTTGPSGSIPSCVEYCATNRTPLYRGLKCGDSPTPRVGLRRALTEWIRAKQRIARNLQPQREAQSGLQTRVRDGCGTVQGAVATWRLRSGRSRRRQVATAPCTVPEIAPLSCKRNRKLI